MTQAEFIASLGLDPSVTQQAYPGGLLASVLQPGQGEWSYWNQQGLSRDQSQYIQNNNFDSNYFRLTPEDAQKWQTDPALQQILQGTGGQVQWDPVYGQYIPLSAQNQWNKQFNNDGIWDTLDAFAGNMPIALGGAVLGAGLGYGPFAGGSLESGAGGALGGGGSGFGGGFGGADALGGSGAADAAGGNMFDWLTDDFWNGLINQGDIPAGGASDAFFGSGQIDPSWWSSAANGTAPVVEGSRQASIGDMMRVALGGNSNIGSLASLANGVLGGAGSYLGAQQQANAANNATAAQMAMFNTLNQQSAPWRQAGQQALGTIGQMMPDFTRQFNNQDLNSQLAPNFQFMLDKGVNATKNALNVGNGLVSGNTIQGINDYAQNYAQNAYQQAFNNWNSQQTNIFNRLSNIAGLGQTANQTSAQAGTALGAGAANSMQNAGTAAGGGIVGATNAVTGGLNNALGWYMLPQFMNYGGQYG